jgi:hypothetical protein
VNRPVHVNRDENDSPRFVWCRLWPPRVARSPEEFSPPLLYRPHLTASVFTDE